MTESQRNRGKFSPNSMYSPRSGSTPADRNHNHNASNGKRVRKNSDGTGVGKPQERGFMKNIIRGVSGSPKHQHQGIIKNIILNMKTSQSARSPSSSNHGSPNNHQLEYFPAED